MKKWIYILIGIVVLLVVITILKGGNEKTIEVTAEEVQLRTIVETVAASGKIQPETEVVISSDVSGEIIEMAVKEGDRVKMGDLLLKINPDLVQSALSRAEASLNTSKANLSVSESRLEQAKAQFENAKATFDRNKALFDNNVISQSEFDNATSSFQVAQAEVEAAEQSVNAARFGVKSSQANLKEAQENLGRTSIYSPMDGTITKMNREQGERVVGTAQMAGTEIMIVADLSSMEVAVEVNENDIVRVNVGDTSLIEVDAFREEKFKGLVTEIANSANIQGTSADQVTNFDVRVRILPSSYQHLLRDSNEISPFKPGMSATVDIQTKTAENVLSVPIQAVTTREDTNSSTTADGSATTINPNAPKVECVFVIDNNKVVQTKVKTGIQNIAVIEILEGLEEGQRIVSGPYSVVSKTLENGDDVKVVEKAKLFKSLETK